MRANQPKSQIPEIAEILATGLGRLLAKKSSGKPAKTGEGSLDFSAAESGHPTPVDGRFADGR
jgi:hypothetical protein